MSFDFLVNHQRRHTSYDSFFLKTDTPLILNIEDQDYKTLIRKYCNGGFFFDDALLIYSHAAVDCYPSIKTVNEVLVSSFENLFKGLISFGQDVFGNQFCFCKDSSNIYVFSIEDGKKELLSPSFQEWIGLLEADYDFIVGCSYIQDWKGQKIIKDDERLCSKIPFIIGGEYKVDNFYNCSFPGYLKTNADIAKQISDLPEGTPVKLKIIPPPSSAPNNG